MADETAPAPLIRAPESSGALERDRLRTWLKPDAQLPTNGHHPAGLFEREPEDPLCLAPRSVERDRIVIYGDVERALFLTRVWREAEASLQALTPWRVRSAWRIVREMARLALLIDEDESLEDIPDLQPDPWTQGGSGAQDTAKLPPRLKRYATLIHVMTGPAGLPLLPPDVPPMYRDNHGVVSEYNPTSAGHDPVLHRYLHVVSVIVQYLQIEHGTLMEPEAGTKGMEGLLDPYLVRLVFPSRIQLCAYEETIVQETLELIWEKGDIHAIKELQVRHGLKLHEAQSCMRMAKSLAKRQLELQGVEEHRAVMVLQLQEQASRYKANGDARNEMAAMKQLAIILGLNKTDPQDLAREFIDIVARHAQRERLSGKTARELVKTIPALTVRTVQDAEVLQGDRDE